MKIGFLSDIHSNKYGLMAIIKELKHEKVEKMFCAGDLIGYYPFPNEVCDLLFRLKIPCVKGNHEALLFGELHIKDEERFDYALDFTQKRLFNVYKKWLENFPKRIVCNISEKRLLMVHGSPWNELEEYIYPNYSCFEKFSSLDYDIIVMGHTHYPFIRQEGHVLIINPGSCGQPRDYNPLASAAVYDSKTHSAKILRVKYNVDAVIRAARELNFSENVIRILYRRKLDVQ
jgi:putative phosphoesterase